MALDTIINTGSSTAGKVNVDAGFNLKVSPTLTPAYMGGVRGYATTDDGTITGTVEVQANIADDYGRLLIGSDILLDTETFDYTAQNTGKHTLLTTTMAASFAIGAFTTNSGGITTINTGLTFGTYAFWPLGTGSAVVVCETEAAFTAAVTTNTTIDFGLFLRAASTPYAPTDGVYFRLTSAGMVGVINYNGTETSTAAFVSVFGGGTWVYNINQKYRFEIVVNERDIDFFIDGTRYGILATPSGNGQPFAAASLPYSLRHAIGGTAASGALSMAVSDYTVRFSGPAMARTLGEFGAGAYGTYQGLSGGTMGSLMSGTVTTGSVVPPGAAVPTNTTAALGTGLGGTFYETASLAVATDGIIDSFQNPAGTVSVQGRRMKVTGVSLGSFIQTVLAGGPFAARWYIAFGHTALSLQTAEAATTKAPRRVMTPIVQTYAVNQAVSTSPAQTMYSYTFQNPIYVNPGEFLALITTHTGTAAASGTIAHQVAWDYTWE